MSNFDDVKNFMQIYGQEVKTESSFLEKNQLK